MIEINLIPPDLRKKKRGHLLAGKFQLPPEVIIGLGGGLLILIILSDIFLLTTNLLRISQHKGLKARWEQIKPDKERVDAVVKDLRALQSKLKSIQESISQNNLFWAQKLNIISDALPRGVWLRKIALNDDVLFIEGSAISKKNQERVNIHAFANNLKKEEKFLDALPNLEISSIQRRNINKIEIADFLMTAKLK